MKNTKYKMSFSEKMKWFFRGAGSLLNPITEEEWKEAEDKSVKEQIELLKDKVELAINQFQSILNASPESWDMTREEFKEEFYLWAKNRARHNLEKLK